MKSKKILIPLAIALLVAVAYFAFHQWNKEIVTIKEKTVTPKEGVVFPVIEIEELRKTPVEEEFPPTISEYAVQDAIHGMSHQKVHADDKWSFLPMTQERIERLTEVVGGNKSSYNDSKLYLEILNRWADNDFSRADKDHNAVWSLQGGNVGRAKGIVFFFVF